MIDEVSGQFSLSLSLSLSLYFFVRFFQGIHDEFEKSSPSRVGNKCLNIHIIRSQNFSLKCLCCDYVITCLTELNIS